MSFGKYTYGSPMVRPDLNSGNLVIGNFCSMANKFKTIYKD